MKTVILIGGNNHRKKFQIHRGQYDIRIPLNDDIDILANNISNVTEVKIETYRYVDFRVGKHSFDNVFFEESLDVELFMKNILLDYFK